MPGWKSKRELIPEAPEFPWEMNYLYGLYGEYFLAPESGGMGPAMATWTGLKDWNELMGHDLDHWELKAIARLSHTRAVIEGEKMSAKAKSDGTQSQNRSG